MELTGSEIITEILAREKVPYAIGIGGHGNLALVDALRRYPGPHPRDHAPPRAGGGAHGRRLLPRQGRTAGGFHLHRRRRLEHGPGTGHGLRGLDPAAALHRGDAHLHAWCGRAAGAGPAALVGYAPYAGTGCQAELAHRRCRTVTTGREPGIQRHANRPPGAGHDRPADGRPGPDGGGTGGDARFAGTAAPRPASGRSGGHSTGSGTAGQCRAARDRGRRRRDPVGGGRGTGPTGRAPGRLRGEHHDGQGRLPRGPSPLRLAHGHQRHHQRQPHDGQCRRAAGRGRSLCRQGGLFLPAGRSLQHPAHQTTARGHRPL